MRPLTTLVPILTAALLAAPLFAAIEKVWVEIEEPHDHALVKEPYPLVEIRGWAGTGVRGDHDVVLVLDRSGSTFEASGIDVDGDGIVGVNRTIEAPGGYQRRIVSDPDDSIARALTQAARRLIDRMDPATTRMGLVTFGRSERVLARVGSSREDLLKALDAIPDRPERGGTYFYGAIIASIKVFETAPALGGRRNRSIIMLSDGLPNRPPPPYFAEKAAVRAAKHADRDRIQIYAIALGPTVAKNPKVFLEIADVTKGQLLLVETPGDVVDFAPHLSLTGIREIGLLNVTTGQKGRAVRMFPDGSFDGFAPLVPGMNTIRFTATGESGGEATVEHRIRFEKTSADTPEGRARIAALLRELEARSIQMKLAEEIRERREEMQRRLERRLEIRPERPDERTQAPAP
jgi:hypothetical protein